MKTILFLDTPSQNRGQIAERAFNSVAKMMGLPWQAESLGNDRATLADLQKAERVIVLTEPAAQARDPATLACAVGSIPVEKVEYWQIDSSPEAALDREVNDLLARLLGGRKSTEKDAVAKPEPPKKISTVRVGRETKGRRGKGVTTVSDVPLAEAALLELAGKLKARCGTGGTVKDGIIEIQGDQRERIAAELEKMGYKVKRLA